MAGDAQEDGERVRRRPPRAMGGCADVLRGAVDLSRDAGIGVGARARRQLCPSAAHRERVRSRSGDAGRRARRAHEHRAQQEPGRTGPRARRRRRALDRLGLRRRVHPRLERDLGRRRGAAAAQEAGRPPRAHRRRAPADRLDGRRRGPDRADRRGRSGASSGSASRRSQSGPTSSGRSWRLS